MKIQKITYGFVVQTFDTETQKFTSQEFIAGDQVEWEDENGDPVEDQPDSYLEFEMIQP